MNTHSSILVVLRRVLLATAVLTLLGSGAALAGDNPAQSDPMALARGAKAWSDNCVRCHRLRDPKDFRDDQWKPVVYHMRVRAGLTGQETRDILLFLQQSN